MRQLVRRFLGSRTKVELLASVPLFDGLSRRELDFLAGHLDEVAVGAGRTVLREGRHNDTFWILLEGEAVMSFAGITHRRLAPGDFFGATSMLDGHPAVATVTTLTPVRALVASTEQFRALQANETVALRLMWRALDRLREQHEADRLQPAG